MEPNTEKDLVNEICHSKWKKFHKAHPSTVVARKFCKSDTADLIDVINGYHAYCEACRTHIYSKSDPRDGCSLFATHMLTATHNSKAFFFPSKVPIFQKKKSIWNCNVCEVNISPEYLSTNEPLSTLVDKHVTSLLHKYNRYCLENQAMSFLLSVSYIPLMQSIAICETNKKFCKICVKEFWEPREHHFRVQCHLHKLKLFLQNKTGFNFSDINDVDKLKIMVSKLIMFNNSLKKNVGVKAQGNVTLDKSEILLRALTSRGSDVANESSALKGGPSTPVVLKCREDTIKSGKISKPKVEKNIAVGRKVKMKGASSVEKKKELSGEMKAGLDVEKRGNDFPVVEGNAVPYGYDKIKVSQVVTTVNLEFQKKIKGETERIRESVFSENRKLRSITPENFGGVASVLKKKDAEMSHFLLSSLSPSEGRDDAAVAVSDRQKEALNHGQENWRLRKPTSVVRKIERRQIMKLEKGFDELHVTDAKKADEGIIQSHEAQPETQPSRKMHKYKGIIVKARKQITSYFCDDCGSSGRLPELPSHIDTCIVPKGIDHVKSEPCVNCSILIVSRRRSQHFDSKEHIAEREKAERLLEEKREEERQQKSLEQVKDVARMKVLKIQGIPESEPDKLQTVFHICSRFGKVEHVKVEGTSATVRFMLQSALEAALQTNIHFHGHVLQLVELEEDVANDPCSVALAPEIIQFLTDPRSLLQHCWDLADEALSLMNNRKEREKEDQLLKAIHEVTMRRNRIRWLVLPFGSRIIGLSLGDSDIDVFTGSQAVFYGVEFQRPKEQRSLCHKVQAWLSQSKQFTNMRTIARTRVPIITFSHIPTGLQCDLSFRNGLSVVNSQLVKFMLSLDIRVRPIILFLKEWIVRNGFKGILTSYAVTIMVLVYLAQLPEPVLPTIELLRPPDTPPLLIAEWNATFTENLFWKSKNEGSVVELLLEFFNFYANYDYENKIIYPITASSIPKEQMISGQDLPLAVKQRWTKIPHNEFDKNIDMCVMDPFDFSHNLTKRIRKHAFTALLQLFNTSYRLLHENV